MNAATSSETAEPRANRSCWKKRDDLVADHHALRADLTIRGVRYSPSMGMNRKITAVTMPGRIWGSRMRRIAVSGDAPRSIAARSWFQSKRSIDE